MILSPTRKRRYLVEESPNTLQAKRHYFLHHSNAVEAAQRYQTPVWVPLGSGWKQS